MAPGGPIRTVRRCCARSGIPMTRLFDWSLLTSMLLAGTKVTGCGGDAATVADGGAPYRCAWPDRLNDAGPLVRACLVGHALVECTYPTGGRTLCTSDDPTQCADPTGVNPPPDGGTCANLCGPNEYAVACGGPPLFPLPDGAVKMDEDAPARCVLTGPQSNNYAFSCCPCM